MVEPDSHRERIRRVESGLVPPKVLWTQSAARATLQARMAYYGVPAVSIAVINDFQVEWAQAYGLRQAGAHDPVTLDTVFQAGSITKPLTAVAALRLVEQGRLELDTDVNDRLVSWKVPGTAGWRPRVTLRHLLSHTGGLTVPIYAGYPRGRPLPTLHQVLEGQAPANSLPVRVTSIPGSAHRYSSGGYAVLQQLLMDITGLPFAELMRELVLGPAGMSESTFEQPLPASRWSVAATGHRNGGQPVDGGWFVYPEAATGGLWTTARDLARFVVDLLRAEAGMPAALLSSKMLTEMLAPQVEDRVGLGIYLEGEGQHRSFSHVGGNEGFSSRIVAFGRLGRGAVIMTNWHYEFLVNEILPSMALEYSWPAYTPTVLRPITVDDGLYEAYVGRYRLRPDFDLDIRRDRHGLRLVSPGQDGFALYPRSDTAFFATAMNVVVTFDRTETGEVTGLVVEQDGGRLLARKLA